MQNPTTGLGLDPMKDAAERVRREHDLINHRLSWLLTSQSALVVAYGFSSPAGHTPNQIREYIPYVGLALCVTIYLGILAALAATAHWHHLGGTSQQRGQPINQSGNALPISAQSVVAFSVGFLLCAFVGVVVGLAIARDFGKINVLNLLFDAIPFVGLAIWDAVGTLVALATFDYWCRRGHQGSQQAGPSSGTRSRDKRVVIFGFFVVALVGSGIGYVFRVLLRGVFATGLTIVITITVIVISIIWYWSTRKSQAGSTGATISLNDPVGRKWTHLMGFAPPAALPLTFSILWCTLLYGTRGFILSTVICLAIGLAVLVRYGQRI